MRLSFILALTFLVQQQAMAQVAASPGKDGILSGAVTYVNTYYPGNSATVAAGADRSIVLGAYNNVTGAASVQITKGDLVLVIQMQGAEINAANTNAYGAGTTTGSGNLNTDFTAGHYDYAVATNTVPLTGGTLTVANLTNTYTNADFSAQGAKRY